MVVEEKGGGKGGGGRKAERSNVDARERSERGGSGDGASVGCECGASGASVVQARTTGYLFNFPATLFLVQSYGIYAI